MSNLDAARFLEQNNDAAETLSADDVALFAQHHAGGLYVLLDYAPDGRCVKLHDTWGGDGPVIVHVYDPDKPDDPAEVVESFKTGREALARFHTLIDGE